MRLAMPRLAISGTMLNLETRRAGDEWLNEGIGKGEELSVEWLQLALIEYKQNRNPGFSQRACSTKSHQGVATATYLIIDMQGELQAARFCRKGRGTEKKKGEKGATMLAQSKQSKTQIRFSGPTKQRSLDRRGGMRKAYAEGETKFCAQ